MTNAPRASHGPRCSKWELFARGQKAIDIPYELGGLFRVNEVCALVELIETRVRQPRGQSSHLLRPNCPVVFANHDQCWHGEATEGSEVVAGKRTVGSEIPRCSSLLYSAAHSLCPKCSVPLGTAQYQRRTSWG